MFLTDCFECGLRELRGARSIETLVSTDHGTDRPSGGMALAYRCTRCATLNLLHAGTSPATAPAPAVHPVAA